MTRLLFIDDDPKAQQTLSMVLSDTYDVISCFTGEQGIEFVREEDPDLVLLDINLPDVDGLEVLKRITAIPAPPPVVMLTIYSDIKLIVAAIKQGAFDYIVKPFNLKELQGTLRQALLARQVSGMRPRIAASCPELDEIVGESAATRRFKELILRYGASGSPVLLLGESGTGKELAARAIHRVSSRNGSFLPVNCGAIPDNLVESELFGTEKGAYTDARKRPGAFELAEGGSIFLDEIGEMPYAAQAKLLRVLEEKAITRLGGTETIPLNVRVIAATHRNLRDEIKSKSFREDLYYRLGVLFIELPPLRERKEDIPVISTFLLEQTEGGRKRLTAEALKRLLNHDWPGNIRELRNVIERATLLSDDESIQPKDIVIE
jgi:two-component system response regulator AtoC